MTADVEAAMTGLVALHNEQHHPGRRCIEDVDGECADRTGKRPKLYSADPDCDHVIMSGSCSGIRCANCPGWFCY